MRVADGAAGSDVTDSSVTPDGHELERRVRERLVADGRLRFRTLQVRRVPRGVCLTGVIRGGDPAASARIAAALAGAECGGAVSNRLLAVPDAD